MAPQHAPFSREQEIWIVQKFGKFENVTEVRRQFRLEFMKETPLKVPNRLAFTRAVDRFINTGTVVLGKSTGY